MNTSPKPQSHTPEPWHCKELIGVTERGWSLFYTHSHGTKRVDEYNGEFTKANAARIVACVNAMAGIADPSTHLRALEGAIKAARNALSLVIEDRPDVCHSRLGDVIRAALAALGGGK